jgi:PKD repeat protein
MSVQSVITSAPDTINIAGISSWRASGYDSTFDGIIDKKIIIWTWDFGDNSQGNGPEVVHFYKTPGTYTVSLTVTGDNFSKSTTTVTVVVTAFTGRIFYVSSSLGNDKYPGTAALPWKTIDKVLSSTSNASINNPDVVLFKCGDVWSYTGDLSLNRPSIWASYGSGDQPLINMPDGKAVYGLDGGGGVPENTYGYSVYHYNLHFKWPTRQGGDAGMQLFVYGSQLTNCLIENASVIGPGGSNKMVLKNTKIINSNYAGVYTNGDWAAFVNCTISGNGSDWIFHHQGYLSSNTHVLIIGTKFDGFGATAASFGCKFSGVRKFFIYRCEALRNNYGFDIGANPDNREGQDGIMDTVIIHDNGVHDACGAIWFTYLNRFTMKNCIIFNCDKFTGQDVLIFRGNDSSQICQNVDVFNNTLFSNDTIDVSPEANIANVRLFNNIYYRDNGSKVFLEFVGTTPTGFSSDYNVFYNINSNPDDQVSFRDGNGKTYSFHEWQSLFNQDIHSVWGDPKFADMTIPDLHIGQDSAAKDMGLTIPIVYNDYDNRNRFADLVFDAGAYLA